MLNMIEMQEMMKGLPEQVLSQKVLSPSIPIEATLALGELQRRQQMKQKAMAQAATPGQTVAGQVVSNSLASAALALTPDRPAPALPPQPGQMQQGPQPAAPSTPAVGLSGAGPSQYVNDAVDAYNRFYGATEGMGDDLRTPDLESLSGALEQAQGLMGEDQSDAIAKFMSAYQGNSGQRRRMDRAALLSAIGSAIGSATGPSFLGNLNAGLSTAQPAIRGYIQNRNSEERQGIADQTALASMRTSRQNQLASAATQLFGQGREGARAADASRRSAAEATAGIASARESAANQLEVARTYASGRVAAARARYPADPTHMSATQLGQEIARTGTDIRGFQATINNAMASDEDKAQARENMVVAQNYRNRLIAIRDGQPDPGDGTTPAPAAAPQGPSWLDRALSAAGAAGASVFGMSPRPGQTIRPSAEAIAAQRNSRSRNVPVERREDGTNVYTSGR